MNWFIFVALVASGFFLGYFLGYRDRRSPDHPKESNFIPLNKKRRVL